MSLPGTNAALRGGQIVENAFCGGGDSAEGISNTTIPIDTSALAQIKAVIMMGNPRYEYGFSYEVETCKAGDFDARPSSFVCPGTAKIQSYCDAADSYCCTGNDANTHEGYGADYGQDAPKFIPGKLSTTATSSGIATSAAASAITTKAAVATSTAARKTSTIIAASSAAPAKTFAAAPGTSSSAAVAKYGKCGGTGYKGATKCASGSTCKSFNEYYSQCL